MLGMGHAMKTIYDTIEEVEQEQVNQTPVEELLGLRAEKPHLAKKIDRKLKGLPDEEKKAPSLGPITDLVSGLVISDQDEEAGDDEV